eukprot:13929692-Ditylum_brightwellii.AAC.1
MNKQVEALKTAKSATVKEICKGLFQKPTIYNNDSKFLQHLRHYANLGYGLLGSASPLYMQTQCTIMALMGLKAAARKSMTPQARASIM